MFQYEPDKTNLEKIVRKVFINAEIQEIEKFADGLDGAVFKITIQNPDQILVLKANSLDNKSKTVKNNQILKYLKQNNLKVPEVFFEDENTEAFITLMSFCPGQVAGTVYQEVGQTDREKILLGAGEELYKIHNLNIPDFWIHHKHEIPNKEAWKAWIKMRIEKYLNFFETRLPNHIEFIQTELNDFWNLLEQSGIDFSPLHGDYHLLNLNVDKEMNVSGLFDFDNAIKGHSLYDLGIFLYFLRFSIKDYKNKDSFLHGYDENLTETDLKLTRGYFLLHLLAITRTLWEKDDLAWIIEEHKNILGEFKNDILK